jgi:hypothetical protein
MANYDENLFVHAGAVTMMWLEGDTVILRLVDDLGVTVSLKTKSVEFVKGYVSLGTIVGFEGEIVGVMDNVINVIAKFVFIRTK